MICVSAAFWLQLAMMIVFSSSQNIVSVGITQPLNLPTLNNLTTLTMSSFSVTSTVVTINVSAYICTGGYASLVVSSATFQTVAALRIVSSYSAGAPSCPVALTVSGVTFTDSSLEITGAFPPNSWITIYQVNFSPTSTTIPIHPPTGSSYLIGILLSQVSLIQNSMLLLTQITVTCTGGLPCAAIMIGTSLTLSRSAVKIVAGTYTVTSQTSAFGLWMPSLSGALTRLDLQDMSLFQVD